ncbi:hypothetical protein OESDEN_11710, partial [Oesophagostomum dentatum]
LFVTILSGPRHHLFQEDELKKLCSWLNSYGGTRLSGVVIPRARFLAVRCLFFSDLTALGKHCSWEVRDLQDSEAIESIRTNARRFLCASPEANYLQMFDEFEQLLIVSMTKIGLGGKIQTRQQLELEVPEF